MTANNSIPKVGFPTTITEIVSRIGEINPKKYASSRNYIDGSVSYLSPYISRGVLSTKQVYQNLLSRGYTISNSEKFIQELAWRDYWQQVWISKDDAINTDLKHPQQTVETTKISKAIVFAKTGIEAVDIAIKEFYETGYLHNHMRMYIASLACNISKNHWRTPAQWMYFHLLDADWASNALSWQWVAAANSNKKYYANQENINRYCHTNQTGTFLDIAYDDFETLETPSHLIDSTLPELKTILPKSDNLKIDLSKPTLIYNFYNLDPDWKKETDANRILLLEPSLFEKYPVSENTIKFTLALAENIASIQVYVGEFNELTKLYTLNHIYFKEHPLSKHYKGIEEPRDWMFSVKGYYPSFFSFWKKCKKELKNNTVNDES